MGNKLTIAVFGLAILFTSQAWAGTAGPGWAARQGTPAQQAAAAHNQDLATAKYCQDHPQVMHTLLACRQATARHPEMFAGQAGETQH